MLKARYGLRKWGRLLIVSVLLIPLPSVAQEVTLTINVDKYFESQHQASLISDQIFDILSEHCAKTCSKVRLQISSEVSNYDNGFQFLLELKSNLHVRVPGMAFEQVFLDRHCCKL